MCSAHYEAPDGKNGLFNLFGWRKYSNDSKKNDASYLLTWSMGHWMYVFCGHDDHYKINKSWMVIGENN